jgi:hypothetical protein
MYLSNQALLSHHTLRLHPVIRHCSHRNTKFRNDFETCAMSLCPESVKLHSLHHATNSEGSSLMLSHEMRCKWLLSKRFLRYPQLASLTTFSEYIYWKKNLWNSKEHNLEAYNDIDILSNNIVGKGEPGLLYRHAIYRVFLNRVTNWKIIFPKWEEM